MRKFLSKDNYDRPHVQYNAVMLIRILADNPGPSFTKNLDKQFADTIKHLLRNGRDPSVAQIVRETLDSMQREKAYDTNLNVLFAMWIKEKGLMANAAKQFGPRTLNAPGWSGQQQQQGGFGSGQGRSSSRTLPSPAELAGRVEEARTSAKLLLQLVQSTPPHELLSNDLVKEFAERCTSAQRSLQGYIACDNPPPDDDTMLTLIETNEQLSLAASKHQRAVLQARRLVGNSQTPPAQQSNNVPAGVPQNSYEPPSGPPSVPPNVPSRDNTPSLPPPNIRSPEPVQPPAPRATNYKNDELPLPPSLQAAPNRTRVSTIEEDPFADPYALAAPVPDHRANGQLDSPASDYSGYQHSYTGRQESAVSNSNIPQARQHGMSEEEEYARDYPAGPRMQTPDRNVPHYQANHDVSPIAERNTVTYRY